MNEITRIEFLDANILEASMTRGGLVENPMGVGPEVRIEQILINDKDNVAVQYSDGSVGTFINTPMKLVFAPSKKKKQSPTAPTEHEGGEGKSAGGQSGPGVQAPAGSAGKPIGQEPKG